MPNSEALSPVQEARLAMCRKEWTVPTKHEILGFIKCNLVIIDKKYPSASFWFHKLTEFTDRI